MRSLPSCSSELSRASRRRTSSRRRLLYARPPWSSSTPVRPGELRAAGGLVTAAFVLEPLGPRHNESDYAAWTSSIEHIQATPGFPWGLVAARDDAWPRTSAISRCTSATSRSARGFTYTVLDPETVT